MVDTSGTVFVLAGTCADAMVATSDSPRSTKLAQAATIVTAVKCHLLKPSDAFIVIGSTDFRRWDEAFLRSGKPIFQIGMPVEDPRIISCGIDEAEARLDAERCQEPVCQIRLFL